MTPKFNLPILGLFAAACVAGEGDSGADAAASPFDAPHESFLAVEPTELGVIAAPTIWDALAPVGRRAPEGLEGDQRSELRVVKGGGGYFADIVQSGLLDDSIMAEHVRLELRLEPEGWFATNAWRRWQCRRGESPGRWTNVPCP
jgi:hypothetical protein